MRLIPSILSRCRLSAFCRNQSGGVLILFALITVSLILIIGGVIDFGSSLVVRSRLGGAADAAALGAAVSPQGVDGNATARRYYEANYRDFANVDVDYDDLSVTGIGTDTITVRSDALRNSNVTNVRGINKISVGVTSVVSRDRQQTPDADIAVVADLSTSMNDPLPSGISRYDGLVAGYEALSNSLDLNDPHNNGLVRLGLVTFESILQAKYPLTASQSQAINYKNFLQIRQPGASDFANRSNTCAGCGIDGAIQMFQSNPAPVTTRSDGQSFSGQKFAIFMTDGLMNMTPLSLIFRPCQGWHSPVPVAEPQANCTTYFSSDSALPPARVPDWQARCQTIRDAGGTPMSCEDESPASNTRIRNDFLVRCQRLKDLGVTIYTIAYTNEATANAGNVAALQSCASTGSDGNPLYFVAPDEAVLADTFTQIGTSIGRIRITR